MTQPAVAFCAKSDILTSIGAQITDQSRRVDPVEDSPSHQRGRPASDRSIFPIAAFADHATRGMRANSRSTGNAREA